MSTVEVSVGVMGLPQASVTAGGVGGVAAEIHCTVLDPLAGITRAAVWSIVYTYNQSALKPEQSVYV